MLETRVKISEAKVFWGILGREIIVGIHQIDQATIKSILATCEKMKKETDVWAEVGKSIEGRVSFKPSEGELYIHIPHSGRGWFGLKILYNANALPEAVKDALKPTYESWENEYRRLYNY